MQRFESINYGLARVDISVSQNSAYGDVMNFLVFTEAHLAVVCLTISLAKAGVAGVFAGASARASGDTLAARARRREPRGSTIGKRPASR